MRHPCQKNQLKSIDQHSTLAAGYCQQPASSRFRKPVAMLRLVANEASGWVRYMRSCNALSFAGSLCRHKLNGDQYCWMSEGSNWTIVSTWTPRHDGHDQDPSSQQVLGELSQVRERPRNSQTGATDGIQVPEFQENLCEVQCGLSQKPSKPQIH